MASLLQQLSLTLTPSGAQPANFAAFYLLSNFTLSYLTVNSRIPKRILGLDHNEAPREDITKYGEAMVTAGKLSRRTLNRIKRLEAAHANGVEHFSFFAASLLFALHAGLPATTVNRFGAAYTLSRVAYSISYIFIEKEEPSILRSMWWWVGNLVCIWTVVKSGQAINA